MRILRTLLFALVLGAVALTTGCIKDQQAARTRLPGVDKPPEEHEPDKTRKVEEKKPEEEEDSGESETGGG
ncbi:MAG: hypothetical protein ACYSX0_10580 [Planctomycetota bacterium]|jgi:hypothetical protein